MQRKTDSKRVSHIVLTLCTALFLVLPTSNFAQSGGTSTEWGGTTDIFDFPVGARAMALGGAYVTVADDPFALYWNPAALENVQAMSISFYHTGLNGGTQYDYLSYVYPTISFGTFSAGILRLGTSNIEQRANDGALFGTDDYNRTLYMVGYGKYIFKWLSIGATAKIENINMPGYFDTGSYSESAVGADFGAILKSPLSNMLLRDWLFGFNYQNAIQRSVQLVEKKEDSPRNFRFGLSRKFYIGDSKNHLLFAYGLDNSEAPDVPNYSHFGGEFGFNNMFMLRLGYDKRGDNTDGYGMTYGMGIRYIGFQLDYSYWSGVDAFFTGSHRVSITADIGKTRAQKVSDRENDEFRRIQDEARKAAEERRKNTYFTGMAEAREYFEKADYPRAFSAINRVLVLDETGADPEFREARELSAQIDEAIARQRQLAIDNEIEKTKQQIEVERRQRLIREHYDKAMALWESEQYREAIIECDRALEYDSNDKAVLDLRKMADADLRAKVQNLLETASDLYKRNKMFEAVQFYREALPLARGMTEIESFVQGRISLLNNQLSYQNLLRQAVDYENSGQWKEAADLYQQALRSNPNNAEVQRKYKEAHARANARQMEPTPEVNRLYTLGMRALRDGDYDDAINYYQQALDEQPLNKTILNALDYARNQKRRAESPEETN